MPQEFRLYPIPGQREIEISKGKSLLAVGGGALIGGLASGIGGLFNDDGGGAATDPEVGPPKAPSRPNMAQRIGASLMPKTLAQEREAALTPDERRMSSLQIDAAGLRNQISNVQLQQEQLELEESRRNSSLFSKLAEGGVESKLMEFGQTKGGSEGMLQWQVRNAALAATPQGARLLQITDDIIQRQLAVEARSFGQLTQIAQAKEIARLMPHGANPANPASIPIARRRASELEVAKMLENAPNVEVSDAFYDAEGYIKPIEVTKAIRFAERLADDNARLQAQNAGFTSDQVVLKDPVTGAQTVFRRPESELSPTLQRQLASLAERKRTGDLNEAQHRLEIFKLVEAVRNDTFVKDPAQRERNAAALTQRLKAFGAIPMADTKPGSNPGIVDKMPDRFNNPGIVDKMPDRLNQTNIQEDLLGNTNATPRTLLRIDKTGRFIP